MLRGSRSDADRGIALPNAIKCIIGRFLAALIGVAIIITLASGQEKVKFPIGVGTKTLGTSMYWLASKRGLFDEVGLEAQLVLLRGSTITIQALLSESVYFAHGAADTTIAGAASGADLLAVGGAINGLTQAIVAGKKYKSIKELRGATIGVQALTSGGANVLKRVLKQNGLEYPADYKMFATGGGSLSLAALISGQIAATYLPMPLDSSAEQGSFNVIGYFKDYFPNYQLSVLAVKRGWAEKNRGLMVRFLKGAVRGYRWLYANKEAAIDFLAKEIPLNPEFARKEWEYYTANRIWPPNGEMNLEGLKFTMQVYADQAKGALPDPMKYVDQSYLQEAIKELDR